MSDKTAIIEVIHHWMTEQGYDVQVTHIALVGRVLNVGSSQFWVYEEKLVGWWPVSSASCRPALRSVRLELGDPRLFEQLREVLGKP